jgi:hypothetical protein
MVNEAMPHPVNTENNTGGGGSVASFLVFDAVHKLTGGDMIGLF